VVIKMAYSLPPEELAADQFAMSKIAVWGPIIPIGLAAASISSAIGSILIAPRTLQALGGDQVFPSATISKFLAKGRGEANEPMNATIFTAGIFSARLHVCQPYHNTTQFYNLPEPKLLFALYLLTAISDFKEIGALKNVKEKWVKPWSHFYHGRCLEESGEFQGALAEYEAAYKFDDNELRFQIDRRREELQNSF